MAGGNKDEVINTMVYDQSSSLIVVGGKTNSANFAPAENDHGYIFGLDLDGNWLWGNFFYNVSYAVSEVTGVKMSSKGTYISVLGYANSKPIVMFIGKTDGQIKKFVTIDPISVTTGVTPVYKTYNGHFYEESESANNGYPYVYVTFVKDSVLNLLKFNVTTLRQEWHKTYY